MRIVAGRFGGRKLGTPRDLNIRPTQDRVREALFSIISQHVEGAKICDLFCGTGALGIEGISRGALSAVFVDISDISLALVRKNLDSLGINATSVKARLPQQMSRILPLGPFSLVFMDPPYAKGLVLPSIRGIIPALDSGALIVAEHEKNMAFPDLPPGLSLQSTRQYGDTCLSIISCLTPMEASR